MKTLVGAFFIRILRKLSLTSSAWLFAEIWQLVFPSVTSKQFWDQVEEENIKLMEAAFAYKHDFQLFGYSAKDYLGKIGKHIGSWILVKIMETFAAYRNNL